MTVLALLANNILCRRVSANNTTSAFMDNQSSPGYS